MRERPARTLHFNIMRPENPISAFCTHCGKVFVGQAGYSMDDVILIIRSEFASHSCDEPKDNELDARAS
jgi:hypothetical protein